jgi:CBS domain-containing protein
MSSPSTQSRPNPTLPIAFSPYQEKYLDTSWLGDRMKIQTLIADKRVHTISANDKVKHLVESLNNFHIGAMVVSLDGKVIDGIVSERDIVRAMPGKLDMMEELHVRDIMTVGVHTCTSDATVSEVMELMTKQRIRHVPVVDADGNLLSIVSIGDVVKHHVNEISVENEALKQYVSGSN